MSDLTLNQYKPFPDDVDNDDDSMSEVTLPIRPHYTPPTRKFLFQDYRVGWICTRPMEMAAAEAMLDERHGTSRGQQGDIKIAYVFGRMRRHNVVIACLPLGSYGTYSATAVLSHLSLSFPAMSTVLMVGIGAGVPSPEFDIRLGDVVVGKQVVQYNADKSIDDGNLEQAVNSVKPPPALDEAASKLASTRSAMSTRIAALMQGVMAQRPRLTEFARPTSADVLFEHTYHHVSSESTCVECDSGEQLHRVTRPSDEPVIHYGTIGFGNRAIKDGAEREKLAEQFKLQCAEMEAAAGLIDEFPCTVIRGISDYADSHKNEGWQQYAALTAAIYAKELLLTIPAKKVERVDPEETTSPSTDRATLSMDDVKKMLSKSLPFVKNRSRQDQVSPALENTCDWFLTDPAYLAWLDPDQPREHRGLLWISGKPGVGKSTLMKFVHDKTQKKAKELHGTVVKLSFFFDTRGAELDKTREGMYRFLLYQFLKQLPDTMDSIYENTYAAPKEGDARNWSLEELEGLVQQLANCLERRRLICFIDVLDECDESQTQDMIAFLEILCDKVNESGGHIHVCFSSRHLPNITFANGSQSVVLDQKDGHRQDIEEYIAVRLRAPTSDINLHPLSDLIREKAADVFLWVVLAVNVLNKELQHGVSITVAERRLENLSSEPKDLLKDILLEDDTDNRGLLFCIRWILYAQRPLKYRELYYALQAALEPDNQETLAAWNETNTTDESMRLHVMRLSRGLAMITESGAVDFIHESVREFLVNHNGIPRLWPSGAIDFEISSHTILRDCCSFYMKANFEPPPGPGQVDNRSRKGGELPMTSREKLMRLRIDYARRHFPFLEYATKHLFDHADAAVRYSLPTRILDSMDFERWLSLNDFFEERLGSSACTKATPMDIFCERGHKNLLKQLLNSGLDTTFPSDRQFAKRHPVITAAKRSDFELVEQLFRGIHVNNQDADGRTLLSVASEMGLEDLIVHLLRRQGADVNIRDHQGYSPLFYASRWHHKIARHILANEYVDLQVLSSPVQLPELSSDGTVEKADETLIRSPLWEAVKWGQVKTVRLLLDFQIVKVGLPIDLVEALVLIALVMKHTAIVRLLLDYLGPSKTTELLQNYGQSILMPAIRIGDVALLDQLLSANDFDCNRLDSEGWSPLAKAAEAGHDATLQRLLTVDGINVNGAGGYARTPPLLHAAYRSSQPMIEQLLRAKDIEVNLADDTGTTPLIQATRMADYYNVERLLAVEGIDVNKHDLNGDTALIEAAGRGSYDIVGMLLDVKGIEINAQNKRGRTAVTKAVLRGHNSVLELLLRAGRGVIQADLADEDGFTPLMYAARDGNRWDLEVLMRTKGVDINRQDHQGRTALCLASERGHVIATELLLSHDKIDLETNDIGKKALAKARELKRMYIVHILETALAAGKSEQTE